MGTPESPLEPKYEPGRSYMVQGSLLNSIIRGLRLQRIIPGPGMREKGTPMGRILYGNEASTHRGRFEVFRSGTRLYVSPGSVSYVEVPTRNYEETPPPVFTQPLIPTIDGTDLDDPDEPPYFDIDGRNDGRIWLVCQQTRCSGLYASDVDEPERIELTDRGDKPDLEDGEHGIPLYDFDIEDGRMTNIKIWVEDDWEQWFRCDGQFDESQDSGFGSDLDSSGSAPPGGNNPSDSSASEETPDDDCSVGMKAKWKHRPKCFPRGPDFGPGFTCVPARYTFVFEVEFTGHDPYGVACPSWAYGVSMPGSITPEIVWMDARTKVVSFEWEHAPACGKPVLVWRARGFGPIKDEEGHVIPSCCGRLWHGQVPKVPVKLPPVCGCACSSSHLHDDEE